MSSGFGVCKQLFSLRTQLVAQRQLSWDKMAQMDYPRARKVLADLRTEHRLGVPELAGLAGLNKTTVYRLEDPSWKPKGKVSLQTIETLCAAMDVTLTEFFARLEGVVSPEAPSPPPAESPRGDSVEAVATRFADVVAQRLFTAPAPIAAKTPMLPVIPEEELSTREKEAYAIVKGLLTRGAPATKQRSRRPPRARREPATGKRKRAS